MTGHFSVARQDRSSSLPFLSGHSPRIAALGLFLLAVGGGCGAPMEGAIDLDAIREKSIAEGKGDPTAGAPTTPEARKERADRLIKEAREKKKPKP
jgi:hypothetical protein